MGHIKNRYYPALLKIIQSTQPAQPSPAPFAEVLQNAHFAFGETPNVSNLWSPPQSRFLCITITLV